MSQQNYADSGSVPQGYKIDNHKIDNKDCNCWIRRI